ncbi:MAG: hypothetical protein KAS72_03465 [Phycisphaerales bacterium]|nr:hypothetical protein [Phycisphaerales bacterium]
MGSCPSQTKRGRRGIRAIVAAASCIIIGSGIASADMIGDFIYDATDAVESVYAGSLASGTLTLESMPGGNYRVQRIGIPGEVALGFYGTGSADLNASLDLVSFNSAGAGGPGDMAVFAGTGALAGYDFIATDEYGETLSGIVPYMELIDDTDALVLPGVLGFGLVTDIVFSDSTFQGIDVTGLVTEGSILTFAVVVQGITLETYLETNGMGGVPLPLETLEMHIAPIPSAPTGLILGIGCMAASRRRRST